MNIIQFNQNAQNKNLQDRVKGVVGNMGNLPFQEEELDLIWSEGAIYNIGLERVLNEWRKFKIERNNLVWGKNWDLEFDLWKLYQGKSPLLKLDSTLKSYQIFYHKVHWDFHKGHNGLRVVYLFFVSFVVKKIFDEKRDSFIFT